jgi:hypothetical protein
MKFIQEMSLLDSETIDCQHSSRLSCKVSSYSDERMKFQDHCQFNENTFERSISRINRGTQTKLHALFLPPSPLAELTKANIDMRTGNTIARVCQVNTLTYLIKTAANSINFYNKTMQNSTMERHDRRRSMLPVTNEPVRFDRYVFARTHPTNHQLPNSFEQTISIDVEDKNIGFEMSDRDYEIGHVNDKSSSTNDISQNSKDKANDYRCQSLPPQCITMDFDTSKSISSNNRCNGSIVVIDRSNEQLFTSITLMNENQVDSKSNTDSTHSQLDRSIDMLRISNSNCIQYTVE